jgi:hypothetical protein
VAGLLLDWVVDAAANHGGVPAVGGGALVSGLPAGRVGGEAGKKRLIQPAMREPFGDGYFFSCEGREKVGGNGHVSIAGPGGSEHLILRRIISTVHGKYLEVRLVFPIPYFISTMCIFIIWCSN